VGVAASCRPTLPQCRGWRCSSRDGVVMAGMAAQGRWRRRRPASLVRRHGVVLGERGAGVCPLFEGSAVLLRGCGALAVQKWAAQCHGDDTGLTAQCRTVAGMASPGGLAERRRDMIPRRVRGMARRGFVFDPGACKCQDIKCSGRGSRYGVGEPVTASSEAESHPRVRPALQRGVVSPEGATGPRARQNLTRGGDQPSSEAEFSPEGGWG
jgi:hypothetical protein